MRSKSNTVSFSTGATFSIASQPQFIPYSQRNSRGLHVFVILALLFTPLATNCEAQDTISFDGLEFIVPSYAQSGTREVVGNNLVLTGDTPDFSMDTDVAGRMFGDVSIRTQFRAFGSDAVGLYALTTLSGELGNPSEGHQLFAFITASGHMRTGQLYDGTLTFFQQSFPSGITTAGQDIKLRLDLFDGLMTWTAWPAGTEMPSPQVRVDLSSTPNLPREGRVGIWTFQQGGNIGPVEFRSVDVVPEPSTCLLGSLGLWGLLAIRRRVPYVSPLPKSSSFRVLRDIAEDTSRPSPCAAGWH